MGKLSSFAQGLFRSYKAYLGWVNNLSDRSVDQNAGKLTNKPSEVISRWLIKVGLGIAPIAVPLLVLLALLPPDPKPASVEVSESTNQPPAPESPKVEPPAPVDTKESTAVPESKPEPKPENIVKPEHRNQTTYVKDTWDQYMVLLQPVGNLGQLSMQIVSNDSEEVVPVLGNCIDLLQKGRDADVLVGETVGIEATFKDYSDWIYTAARSFCKDDQSGTTGSESSPTQASTSQVSSTTAEANRQSSTSYIVQAGDGYANLRSQPSTEVASVSQIKNGTQVTVVDKQTNDSGQLWYRVEVNGQSGWIFSELLRSS